MRTNKLIARFEEAVRADEVKGGGRPECMAETEQELAAARLALQQEIVRIRMPSWLMPTIRQQMKQVAGREE